MKFLKKVLCEHIWATMLYSYGYYDVEIWHECTKCKKQLELDEYDELYN